MTEYSKRHSENVQPVDVDTLLEQSDFVSLHVPLTESNRHMIGAAEISKMKNSAYIINCSRGPLVDEAALVDAVRSGRIAGAGLDVFEEEPPAPDSPVLNCPAIIVTPHCASHTERALSVVRKIAVDSVIQAIEGRWPDNVYNPEVKSRWLKRFGGKSAD